VRQILLAIALGPPLWLAGAVFFDGVHWVLHGMLRSRSRWLRRLARPHAVHHAWIDRDLQTNLALRRANIACHIVPEYATQLLFTALVLWLLPWPFAAVLFALQTGVFVGILAAGGQDLNHRPARRIDAHPPGWLTPPAYHALHHAFPDAHFSAYTKLVDWAVGGGSQIAGRGFAFVGPDSAFARALQAEVRRLGGRARPLEVDAHDPPGPQDPDVLVLLDPTAPLDAPVETFIAATRERRLPPEVWAVRASPRDALARHYVRDVRVTLRILYLPDADLADAARAARRALFRIRRDAHFVAAGDVLGLGALRRFLRTAPRPPEGALPVRHRLELAAPAGAGR
jgi:hypothetical protein